ncbi:hypothetical protein PAPHI01_1586 [Pancytospora philotis]|nr:hypothetical protein PAPHI01_1586 [Pancytospora philotis]
MHNKMQSAIRRKNLRRGIPCMLCGEPGAEFRCGEFTCVLNSRFNVVLYTGCTAVRAGVCKPFGFIVPTHYLSFIKTMNRDHGLETDVTRIFTFENAADAAALRAYVRTQQGNAAYTILGDLVASEKKAAPARYGARPRRSLPRQ